MSSPLWPLQVFDPKAGFSIVERKLPHWVQAGTIAFITFRSNDSIPEKVLRRWYAEREAWLLRHGIDPRADDWRAALEQRDRSLRDEFTTTFSERWHHYLDDCHGACVLSRPAIGRIVADSLLHFDGQRYLITDFVVMPNHVHLLAAFADEQAMLEQCDSWKHYTARQINSHLGSSGRFWQQDGFDHLVRSVEHFEAFRRYIAENPTKARLQAGQYIHYSKGPL
jgi:type I restriction enzyme R subunit